MPLRAVFAEIVTYSYLHIVTFHSITDFCKYYMEMANINVVNIDFLCTQTHTHTHRFKQLAIMTHQLYQAKARIGFISNKYIPSRSQDLVHILALQLVQLSE